MTPQIAEYLVEFETALRPFVAVIVLGLIWMGAARMEGSARSRYLIASALSATAAVSQSRGLWRRHIPPALGRWSPGLAIRAVGGDRRHHHEMLCHRCGRLIGQRIASRFQSGFWLVSFWNSGPRGGARYGWIDLSRPRALSGARCAKPPRLDLSAGDGPNFCCSARPDAAQPRVVATAATDRIDKPLGQRLMPIGDHRL